MKKILAVFFVLHCLNFVRTQDNATVDRYVSEILTLNQEILSYRLPENSKSYLDGASPDQVCTDAGIYDFVIVGAGAAGSVIANRLTEIEKWNVLLLEAGGLENNITDIPAEDRNLWLTKYNWGYVVAPQKYMQGYVNNSITIPRGKALGGSTVINSLIYARGTKADYDKWASEGNPGWSFDDVLPYFKKSENTSEPFLDPGYDGHNGPWHMEYSRIFDKIGEAFLEASKEKGRPTIDYNGKNVIGSSILQVNEINGRRDSTGKSFLRKASKRNNLRIIDKTLVLKILINKILKEATGVKYIKNGIEYCVRAKKEVILSAGSLNSPQLLTLSGIGPAKELKKFGIDPIKHLPVGENLWDHALLTFPYFTSNYSYAPLPKTAAENVETIRKYVIEYLNGEGPYTSSGMEQAIGYASPYSNNTEEPDVEYVLHAGRDSGSSYETAYNRYHYTEDTYKISQSTVNLSAFHIHAVLLHPKSRGHVRLQSSSPFDFPIVDPKYFTHPEDLLVFLSAIKDILSLAQTKAYQKYNATLYKIVHPLCEKYTYLSDDFWLCMIKTLATTTHHFGGSCTMGPKWKNTTVVDRFLKVHGISKLRVADCSVIPVSLSGHTGSVGVMIGEKAGDIIKKAHGQKL